MNVQRNMLIRSEKLKKKLYQATSTNYFGNMNFVEKSQNWLNLANFVQELKLEVSRISLFVLPMGNSLNVGMINLTKRFGPNILRQDDEDLVKIKNFSANKNIPELEQGIGACITCWPNNFLGVLHADNAPVIIYDQLDHYFAIINVGILGALSGIITNTVECMQNWCNVKPEQAIAYIGPCFSADFKDIKTKDWPIVEKHFSAGHGTSYLLKEIISTQLVKAGIKNIEASSFCTIKNSDLLFSDSLAGSKEDEKKNLTIIGI